MNKIERYLARMIQKKDRHKLSVCRIKEKASL